MDSIDTKNTTLLINDKVSISAIIPVTSFINEKTYLVLVVSLYLDVKCKSVNHVLYNSLIILINLTFQRN